MSPLLIILIIILLLGGFGSLPSWNHSSDWGYGPSGGFGLLLLIIILFLIFRR